MSETIPEDVMEAARAVAIEVECMPSDGNVRAIALALLARDERAAKKEREAIADIVLVKRTQAEHFWSGALMGGHENWSARGAISVCNDIASAIRDRSKP